MKGIRPEANEPPKPWLLRHGAHHKGAGEEDKASDNLEQAGAQKEKGPAVSRRAREKSCLLA
jgi:hypothetical protein